MREDLPFIFYGMVFIRLDPFYLSGSSYIFLVFLFLSFITIAVHHLLLNMAVEIFCTVITHLLHFVVW